MHRNRMHNPQWVRALCALSLLFVGPAGCTILAGGAAIGAAGGAIASRDIRVRTGAPVRVEFTRAPDIPILLRRAADTTWLRKTEYLIGRIERTRGDTLWLDLSESRTAESRMSYGRGQAQVSVDQRGPGTSVVVLTNRPAYMVGGAALGTAVSAAAILVYCRFNRCLD